MKPDLIIFTDGSAQIGKPQYGGYSCVFIDPKSEKFSVLYDNVSSDKIPYLELLAIYKAVYHSDRIRKERKLKHLNVVIISDHKNHINALNSWIWESWDTSDEVWKKKNNETVKNQKLYKDILTILDKGKLTVRFAHMNSHMKVTDSCLTMVRHEMEDLGINISYELAEAFIKFNQIADAYAKYGGDYYTKKWKKSPIKLR